MVYVELLEDCRVVNVFNCKTIPEAKRMAAGVKAMIPSTYSVRILKEIEE